MQREVAEMLNPRQSGIYVDATVGLGGHAERIVDLIGAEGKLIGIDRDNHALQLAQHRLSDRRVLLRKGNFSDIESILAADGIRKIDGIVFDLGVSMLQFKDAQRGFSFLSNNRLDMRMNTEQELTAWHVVNKYPEKELVRIMKEFGEERNAKKIARLIVKKRKEQTIDTCAELSQMIMEEYPKRGKLHPATKVFQALRIEVNRELDQLGKGLSAAAKLLRRGGRLCVISYHSLEDRIVKRFMAECTRTGQFKPVTKKPQIPSAEETAVNPSARSAKMRVAEKVW